MIESTRLLSVSRQLSSHRRLIDEPRLRIESSDGEFANLEKKFVAHLVKNEVIT